MDTEVVRMDPKVIRTTRRSWAKFQRIGQLVRTGEEVGTVQLLGIEQDPAKVTPSHTKFQRVYFDCKVSLTRIWDLSLMGKYAPLNIGRRFHYMAIKNNRQKVMPMADDHLPVHGNALAYPEIVLLTNFINPDLKREMFLSSHYLGKDLVPKFQNGESWKKAFGPVFIYLNSELDGEDQRLLWEDAKVQMSIEVQSWPYTFSVFEDFPSFDEWGTVTGRLLVHDRSLTFSLPYNNYFFYSKFHMIANINVLKHCCFQQFHRLDTFINKIYPRTRPMLAWLYPGTLDHGKKNTRASGFGLKPTLRGYFTISDIRSGNYNLYSWVPGFIGDYKYDEITITAGSKINLDVLVYESPRDNPTL
ncbi:hypothetical protein GIB67_021007 [Kingdonia uniflora]|uniref:Rhamnogalacturonan lyase domain-containing protein n=1 Tax=Kingdonia uniflora TaxID=39325 RepID=A0A7J7N7H8_9MAGN|nr:hypothetical protein GIB67_021007 [Kingdonia uniflora]